MAPPRELTGLAAIAPDYDAVLLDAWGVLHDGTALYPAAAACLRQLSEHGLAVVIVTNAARREAALCDELAVIERGRVVASGSMQDLRHQAETEAAGLEEIFLKITRGATDDEIVRAVGG